MSGSWWMTLAGVGVALLVIWALMVFFLWRARPDDVTVKDSLRLLPDLLRLLKRLASDRSVPRRTRLLLWAVLVYLALPIDLVPDVIPVIGYADDAVVVALAIRSAVRHAGRDVVERLWPGTPEGLQTVLRLARAT